MSYIRLYPRGSPAGMQRLEPKCLTPLPKRDTGNATEIGSRFPPSQQTLQLPSHPHPPTTLKSTVRLPARNVSAPTAASGEEEPPSVTRPHSAAEVCVTALTSASAKSTVRHPIPGAQALHSSRVTPSFSCRTISFTLPVHLFGLHKVNQVTGKP